VNPSHDRSRESPVATTRLGSGRESVLWLICALLFAALVCLLLLDAWGLSLWGSAIDYNRFGNWSSAIEGVATLGAVVVAFAALLRERAMQRTTAQRDELLRETAVFQWLSPKEVRDDDKLVGRVWDVIIQNSTDAPIYQWQVTFESPYGHLCHHQKRPLLPGANIFNAPTLDNLAVSAMPEPTLCFQGRSGRAWRRSARGLLNEATAEVLACTHS
jgi:hypothetical protein